MPEENQPQVEEVKEEPKAEVETPQPEVKPEQEQLGAEEKPQEEVVEPKVEEKPPERTYSQGEWAKRESELNKQTEEANQRLAQVNLKAETALAEQAEREATAKDQKEVDDGSLTVADADKKRDVRTQQRQTTEVIAKQQYILRQMTQQTEQYGRVLAAQDFGKEYELSTEQVTELLSDRDIKTPGDMKAKAANLALEKVKGELKKVKVTPQKFDSGQSGGVEVKSPDKKLGERYPSMKK